MLLGGALFALDHSLNGREPGRATIVVAAAVDEQAVQVFKTARGREPDSAERAALHQRWLDNEVLYREGLALQLDKGDSTIRDRVIFKALNVVETQLRPPVASEQQLRDWFEANRSRYDQPPRFDFQEAALVGSATQAEVRAFVQALNQGEPGDARAGLRVFKGRPLSNLNQSYGETFAAALQAVPPAQWQALPTRDGWRAMRLVSVTPGQPADFASLRGVLLQDWTDATLAELRTAAVRQLARKYSIQTEPGLADTRVARGPAAGAAK